MQNIKSKFLAQFLAGTFGATLIGITSFIGLLTYGGNNGCWAFVDKLFGTVGYESCGSFGAIVGGILGLVVGLLIATYNRNHTTTYKVLALAGLIFFAYGLYMLWPPHADNDIVLAAEMILLFLFVSAIVSLVVTTLLNWRQIFKKNK